MTFRDDAAVMRGEHLEAFGRRLNCRGLYGVKHDRQRRTPRVLCRRRPVPSGTTKFVNDSICGIVNDDVGVTAFDEAPD